MQTFRVKNGIDLLHLPRIQRMLEKRGQRAVLRLLTPAEQTLFAQRSGHEQIRFLGGRFALKEAVGKALGTGLCGKNRPDFQQIEILPDAMGALEVRLAGQASLCYERLNGFALSVSLSHEKDYCVALCTLLCFGGQDET